MGLMTGSLPSDLHFAVKGLEKQLLDTMERCCNALIATGTGPNAALTRWFGDNTPAFRKEIRIKIAKMRSMLNAKQIECKTDIRGGDTDENAASTFTTGGVFGGSAATRVAKITNAAGFIRIGPNFKTLATTASGVASGWTGQDKLETLLHELSHYVHDTDDELLDDGTEAYEAQNARLLVNQSVARAKNNAENWGFFIEDCGT
jgi:hypothetical protein